MDNPVRSNSGFLTQEAFIARLRGEQRRTERSRRPFVLLLVESPNLLRSGDKHGVCRRILNLLGRSTRETDICGWYETGACIGLIFTEVGTSDAHEIGSALARKVRGLLNEELTADQVSQFRFSYFVFPDDWDKGGKSPVAALYPASVRSRRPEKLAKRCVDVCGSLLAILAVSPLFLIIGIAIKLTSKGPVFFRQKRVGQYGHAFTFLKFRSMEVNNDHSIHQEYVKNLIAGSAKPASSSNGTGKVYKIANDPRVTPVGRFLRRSSLDEIPQFINVLLGDMSLVGPRPPISYEVEKYDIWHRRRLLDVKPGITGLWQVHGRSRTTFDEMVRLDLRYARSWTVWMDVKILLQTPRAVLTGSGAY